MDNLTAKQRLAKLAPLAKGSHPPGYIASVTEAAAYVAGEPWPRNYPECASLPISVFLRKWNDALSDDVRDTLLRPFVLRLVDSKADEAIEQRRALMAFDWLVRSSIPAWLRAAKLDITANALACLPEIVSIEQVSLLRDKIESARREADTINTVTQIEIEDSDIQRIKVFAWNAAVDSAWHAAEACAWAIDVKTNRRHNHWASIRSAVGTCNLAAAEAAVGIAESNINIIASVRDELQQSALALVSRMFATMKL